MPDHLPPRVRTAPRATAPYPTTPVRQFSFTNFSTNNPTTPQPGNNIDSEYDRSNASISQIINWLGVSLNTDGTLRTASVGAQQIAPGVFDFIATDAINQVQPLVDDAQAFASSASASSSTAQAAATAADTSNANAQGAATAAQTSAGNATTQAQAANASALAAKTSATDASNDANSTQGDVAICTDYGVLTQAWAEHMPDPIPPNILAVMGITGDHWSSRWWATKAEAAFGSLTSLYLGAWPVPPTSTATNEPIPIGAIYYNTTSQQAFIWDGTEWVPLYKPAKSYLLTLLYRAVANQTGFALTALDLGGNSYRINQGDPEPIEVFVNGARTPQNAATGGNGDWDINNATSTVTFTTPLLAGSLVQIDIMSSVGTLAPSRVQTQALLDFSSSFDGTVKTFNLAFASDSSPLSVGSAQELFISLDGAPQQPGTDFTVSGSTITFFDAPVAGARSWGLWYGPGLTTSGPSTGYLPLTGGVLSGPLTLQPGMPTASAQAANKAYVDSIAGGARSIVNVLDHGAKGDGTTDDTAAIQGVLNTYASTAIVFLPWTGANYRTGQLTLPGGTEMLLNGVLFALPGLPSGYVQAVNTNNIIIRGFGYIDANGTAQTAVGGMACLAISNCTNVRVSGITLRNAFHWNFNITQSSDVVLDGINVVDTQTGVGGAAPEFAAECNDCWLMNSLIDGTNCGDYAFCFYGGVTNSGAIGNVVRNAGIATTGGAPGIGILSDGAGGSNTGQPCKNITISNNIVHHCQGPGISSLYATGDGGFQNGVIIADNICYGNNLLLVGSNVGDVFVDYSINVLITGNQLSANGSASNTGVAGIYLGGNSSKITVTGNQIYNIGQGSANGAGIWTNASYTSISGNHIFDSQTTPTMNRSIIGGSGPHVSIIGNFLDLPTSVGNAPDTVNANAMLGVWTVGDPGGVTDHIMAIAGAQSRRAGLQYQTQGLPRWLVGTDGATDTGSNVGSNYVIASYNDAAVLQPPSFSINRATGQITFGTLPINAANDAAAQAAGVPPKGIYRNGSVMMIRVS